MPANRPGYMAEYRKKQALELQKARNEAKSLPQPPVAARKNERVADQPTLTQPKNTGPVRVVTDDGEILATPVPPEPVPTVDDDSRSTSELFAELPDELKDALLESMRTEKPEIWTNARAKWDRKMRNVKTTTIGTLAPRVPIKGTPVPKAQKAKG